MCFPNRYVSFAVLCTKHTGFRPCGFREDFLCFLIIDLWQIMTPIGVVNLDPRGMVDRIYKGITRGIKHDFPFINI